MSIDKLKKEPWKSVIVQRSKQGLEIKRVVERAVVVRCPLLPVNDPSDEEYEFEFYQRPITDCYTCPNYRGKHNIPAQTNSYRKKVNLVKSYTKILAAGGTKAFSESSYQGQKEAAFYENMVYDIHDIPQDYKQELIDCALTPDEPRRASRLNYVHDCPKVEFSPAPCPASCRFNHGFVKEPTAGLPGGALASFCGKKSEDARQQAQAQVLEELGSFKKVKETILQNLSELIADEGFEDSLLPPLLERFNRHPGLVSVYSCQGHRHHKTQIISGPYLAFLVTPAAAGWIRRIRKLPFLRIEFQSPGQVPEHLAQHIPPKGTFIAWEDRFFIVRENVKRVSIYIMGPQEQFSDSKTWKKWQARFTQDLERLTALSEEEK